MSKIKSVTSINQQGTKSFIVGYNNVSYITNNSLEFEDSIHIQFDAYDSNDNLIGTFINGALAVDYFSDEEIRI